METNQDIEAAACDAYGRLLSYLAVHWRDLQAVEDALALGKLLLPFAPREPEIYGLLALMLHCEARRGARYDGEGNYVPLSEQSCTRWEQGMIMEAERYLHTAAQAGGIGRFQLMAAIQSVHAQCLWTGRTEWEAIAQLYEGLVRKHPTLGALVGRAGAVAEAYGAERLICSLRRLLSSCMNNISDRLLGEHDLKCRYPTPSLSNKE